MSVVDLRSDTLTRPTEAMRRAMLDAPVGDDVYAEDETVNALEARVAELFGHEAGLFCTTGSLTNLLGIWALVRPGDEVLCDAQAHIVRAELGAHAALHGITTRTWTSSDGTTTADQLAGLIAPDNGPFLVRTTAIEVENTHNFGGGTVWNWDDLAAVSELAASAGLGRHLDGARIWNAHVATGVPLQQYGRLFDTVSVCFSKGLGAPVGSMLLADRETIDRARVQRKRLGGGWRQAGLLAAAASHALDHHVERLADDHAAARALAEQVALAAPGACDPERVETNIVVVDTGARAAGEVVAELAGQGFSFSVVGAHAVRAVTHLDVDLEQCRAAGGALGELLSA